MGRSVRISTEIPPPLSMIAREGVSEAVQAEIDKSVIEVIGRYLMETKGISVSGEQIQNLLETLNASVAASVSSNGAHSYS
jgi:hypothetical protein